MPVLAKGKTDTARCWIYLRDDRRPSGMMFEFIAARSPSVPRRQALLRTIEQAASIASIKVRPALAPAQISLKLYSTAWRAALSAASSSSPERRSATFRMTAARSIARWSKWRVMIAPATLPRAWASLMSLEDGPVTRFQGYRIAGLRAVSRLTPFLPLLTGQTSSDTQPLHAYLGHLSDAATEAMLNELATELGAALGQERIYVVVGGRRDRGAGIEDDLWLSSWGPSPLAAPFAAIVPCIKEQFASGWQPM